MLKSSSLPKIDNFFRQFKEISSMAKKLLHLAIFSSCCITLVLLLKAIQSEDWLVSEFEHKGIFRSCKIGTTRCKIHRDGPTVICLGGSTLAVTFAGCALFISIIIFLSDDDFMFVISASSFLCFFVNMYAVRAFEEFANNRVKRRDEFWYGWGYDYACYGTYWAFITFKLSLINIYTLTAQNQQPPIRKPLVGITRFRVVRYVQYSLNIRQRRSTHQQQPEQQLQLQQQQQLRQQQQLQRMRQLQHQQQQQRQQRIEQHELLQQQQEIRNRQRRLQHQQQLRYLQELLQGR